MTGKRAVFLVDMSGSMGKRDLNNLDVTKWPLVIETVCKVMRSIPTLERYQVIVFSSTAKWLFGDREWRPYEGEKSVAAVSAALLKVKPQDDTNMFAALEKAFDLRAGGLDTIYLFSDGLPTSGPGLTEAQQNANPPLSEAEQGVILGKHVRETLTRTWNRAESVQPRVKINSVGFFFDSPDVGRIPLVALPRKRRELRRHEPAIGVLVDEGAPQFQWGTSVGVVSTCPRTPAYFVWNPGSRPVAARGSSECRLDALEFPAPGFQTNHAGVPTVCPYPPVFRGESAMGVHPSDFVTLYFRKYVQIFLFFRFPPCSVLRPRL